MYLLKAQNHLISSNATKLAIKVKYISQKNTMSQWAPVLQLPSQTTPKSKILQIDWARVFWGHNPK